MAVADTSEERLEKLLLQSPLIDQVLRQAAHIRLRNWYLAAGCVAQTVWNVSLGKPPAYAIKDLDLVYFDGEHVTADEEQAQEDELNSLFGGLGVNLDVTNEARVHHWYAQRRGHAIAPYRSVEDAIATFPTTATAVGVRYRAGKFEVCAPFGPDNLLGLVLRPNKRQVTESTYRDKVARWSAHWPELQFLSWTET